MAKNKKDKNLTAEDEIISEEKTQNEESTEACKEQEETPGRNYEAELAAEKDRYLRLAAEYDNYRKRTQKEREALYSDVRIETVAELLPVYDNLARALAAECADAAFYKGVQMTMNQLVSIFEKVGIEPIETVGKAFDPSLHNAVLHVEDESYETNVIVEEFQKGFKYKDKVIRFAMVKVAN
jgi:molecular chaperone GrpE